MERPSDLLRLATRLELTEPTAEGEVASGLWDGNLVRFRPSAQPQPGYEVTLAWGEVAPWGRLVAREESGPDQEESFLELRLGDGVFDDAVRLECPDDGRVLARLLLRDAALRGALVEFVTEYPEAELDARTIRLVTPPTEKGLSNGIARAGRLAALLRAALSHARALPSAPEEPVRPPAPRPLSKEARSWSRRLTALTVTFLASVAAPFALAQYFDAWASMVPPPLFLLPVAIAAALLLRCPRCGATLFFTAPPYRRCPRCRVSLDGKG